MSTEPVPDYSSVVSATGFLRPRASRSLPTFQDHLITSRRILALFGAGLSASSGLPTYRGAGGLWRTHDATQLCTPAAFDEDPALVWEFHLERRKEVQEAKPNAAHYALAELSKRKSGFLALTMNVDDLSEKAGHLVERLWHLHGKLFDVRCSKCELCLSGDEATSILNPLLQHNPSVPVRLENVPRCPRAECPNGLLRPGVVWFTESLPQPLLTAIATWINNPSDPTGAIDSMLVVGTSALVYPATAYIEAARKKGARVAVVDIAKEDPSLLGLEEQDWYFEGDAAKLVPEMLEPVIGTLGSETNAAV
ncbi:silent information regulator protein Sir2p [Lentithecium fluviatile CBS 122367]|uniref:Silent information regulator protein Sir2p n=1 Tax=Lentithecium fluviatile CBS 122367 TaxID=1168545 RepID=A0A6G1J1Z3_9PLEO|nr:silent information regulator protein Sir2p [Lentithecium fluviatile CBS 122367]